jgi:hypothetical protein
MFNGVVDLREAMPLMGSSSQSSSGLMPCVSQIHLDYSRVQEELRAMQDELEVERKANRAMRDLLASYNTQMQAFMVVRKKNTFLPFLSFSDMYMC